MNAYAFLSFFLIPFRLGNNAVFILIIFTLHISPFCLVFVILLFCIIFCQCLSRIMFRYFSKFEHSLTPNVFTKSSQLIIARKLECMIWIFKLDGACMALFFCMHVSMIICFDQRKYAPDLC